MRSVSFVRVSLISTLVGVVMLATPLTGPFSASVGAATTKKPAAPSCSTVTPLMIKQTLKLTVSLPKRSAAAGNTDFLCQYGDKVSSLAVIIEFNTASSASSFKTVEDGFNTNGEPTTGAGKYFGSLVNESFSASFGSGQYAQHSVVALQKKLEVDVASSAPISMLAVLMKKILLLV